MTTPTGWVCAEHGCPALTCWHDNEVDVVPVFTLDAIAGLIESDERLFGELWRGAFTCDLALMARKTVATWLREQP